MPVTSSITSLLWFVAIVAFIPLALWFLKRTPVGSGAAAGGLMRTVAVLPLSPSQRVITVEVGQGDGRRWLVLGVTPQAISTLHTMSPQQAPNDAAVAAPMPFAQLLGKWQK